MAQLQRRFRVANIIEALNIVLNLMLDEVCDVILTHIVQEIFALNFSILSDPSCVLHESIEYPRALSFVFTLLELLKSIGHQSRRWLTCNQILLSLLIVRNMLQVLWSKIVKVIFAKLDLLSSYIH